jgi:hypothetical protein
MVWLLILFVVCANEAAANGDRLNRVAAASPRHRVRHNRGLDLPRRFARQTVAPAANLSWPMKRSADIEGDVILGE